MSETRLRTAARALTIVHWTFIITSWVMLALWAVSPVRPSFHVYNGTVVSLLYLAVYEHEEAWGLRLRQSVPMTFAKLLVLDVIIFSAVFYAAVRA